MHPPIHCIAVDLDGTLLNSRHQISPATKKALRRALTAGIEVVIATGKTRLSTREVVPQLGLSSPGVYSQGLVIANADGSISHQEHLPDAVTHEAAKAAQQLGLSFVIYKDIEIFTTENDRWTMTMADFAEPDPQPCGSIELLMKQGPFQKIILMEEPAYLDQVTPALLRQFAGRASLFKSQAFMLEVVPAGTSKGAGLKRLLDDLEISFENVIAFGDGDNDLEMIQWAGIGVAMGNAMPNVKAAADFVTRSNDEDGIAFALDKFL